MNKIIKAAQIAKEAHFGVKRKYSDEPFIVHPMWVAGRACLLHKATEEMVAAAWVHDVLEDCEVAKRQYFQSEIICLDGVLQFARELTNEFKKEKYPHLNRADRKKCELVRIRTISDTSKILKFIDRIHNVHSIPIGADDNFLRLYLGESEELCETLQIVQQASMMGTVRDLTEELMDLIKKRKEELNGTKESSAIQQI